VIAEKMHCGSANLTDTLELSRWLKGLEQDTRKIRNGRQYCGCVLTATGTHRHAVYDRTSECVDQLPNGSGETERRGGYAKAVADE